MSKGTRRAARPSRKLLHYALYGLAAIALAIGGAILYWAFTFDSRDYHARIVDFVRNRTGRTLDIGGGIEVSLWPDPALRLGALTLSERDSSETFASIESARVRLELAPLLGRELVISEVVLVGAKVNIVRFEDGRLNVDDLLQGDGGTPQFDIGRVSVERSSIAYSDLRSGNRYVADELALETGRLANHAVTPVRLALRLRDEKHASAVTGTLQGRVGLDLAERRYTLEQATLALHGRVPGMDDLAFRASGNAEFERATSELRVRALAATLAGTFRRDDVAVALDAASVRFLPRHAAGESLNVSIAAAGPAGRTDIRIACAALARTEDRIASDAVSLDLVLERGGHRLKAAIATALDAKIAARNLTLKGMAAEFAAAGPRLPRKGVTGAMKGDVHLDVARQGVQAELAGAVAGSRVKAHLTAADFASPVYTFAVDVDRFDLDRYVESGGRRRAPRSQAGRGSLLAPLAGLPATGSLHVGLLTAAGTSARDVRLTLQ